jgi:hypothetical protein
MPDNFKRMMALVTEFFDARNDPDQISVTPDEQKKLHDIHPATLSELANEDGPIVWILLVPTTNDIMQQFLSEAISEKQLLQETPTGASYDAIYLCSASVLPELQRKGLAKQVSLEAIAAIRKDHPIKSLFYWPFSGAGKALARSLARETGMELRERQE